MAQPDPYDRQTNFTGTEAGQSTSTLGVNLDKEFDEIHLTVAGLRTNIGLIQRDDGELANASVGIDQFAEDGLALVSGFNARGEWAAGTVYAIGDWLTNAGGIYLVAKDHTATVFSDDTALKNVIGPLFGSAAFAGLVAANNLSDVANLAAAQSNLGLGNYALKSYVDSAVTGLLKIKGSTDCSANPNFPAASKGDAYVVTAAGKIGGASGITVEVGDFYFAIADNAGGTQGAVGASWDVLQYNIAIGGSLALAGAVGSSGLTMSTNKLLGRYSASTGAIQEIALDPASLAIDGSGNLSAYGSAAVLGPVWQKITFSGSTSTQLGIANCNAATTTITLADNQRLEIESYVYKIAGNAAVIGVTNGTTGFCISAQGDGNIRPLYYTGGTFTGIGGTGVDALHNITGTYDMQLRIQNRTGSRQAVGAFSEGAQATSSFMTDVNVGINMSTTLTVFVQTDDVTKCYARVRVLS